MDKVQLSSLVKHEAVIRKQAHHATFMSSQQEDRLTQLMRVLLLTLIVVSHTHSSHILVLMIQRSRLRIRLHLRLRHGNQSRISRSAGQRRSQSHCLACSLSCCSPMTKVTCRQFGMCSNAPSTSLLVEQRDRRWDWLGLL